MPDTNIRGGQPGLLTENPVYKPFRYPWAYEAWLMQQRVHWLPEEVPLADDVRDWHKNLTDGERNLLTQIFRFFTTSDIEVNNCYMKKYSQVFKPTEVLMMLSAFSNIECFDRKTELLTSTGWKFVDTLTMEDRIAQYDLTSEEISFTTPTRIVQYPYTGPMHHYEDATTSICVTPNHDLIVGNIRTGSVHKRKSMECEPNSADLYPVAGKKAKFSATIDYLDRLLIAAAIDGIVTPDGDGGYKVEFHLRESHKVGQLTTILTALEQSPQWVFDADGVITTACRIKGGNGQLWKFDFIPLEITAEVAAGYLLEILKWSNWHSKSFQSTNKAAVDKVHALAVLSGTAAIVSESIDISTTTRTVYTVTIAGTAWRSFPKRKEIAYDDAVFCVSVPTENIVSRRNGHVAITGNTVHIAAYSHLLDTIGMPETEYAAFLKYKEMKDKFDYMQGFNIESKFEIARTLAAFGAFTEGLQLFASFAILLNFPRFGKMKGMGQIITWSVRDECFAEGTEILTPRGWVDFADLTDEDRVAQWDNGVVDFVRPSRRVEYDRTEPMLMFHTEKTPLTFCVTPEHDVVYLDELRGNDLQKRHAADFVPHARRWIPIAGLKYTGRDVLTPLERVRIAFAADGCLPDARHTGERAGYLRVTMNLTKQRKITRLHNLLYKANISYDTVPGNGESLLFRINVPVDISKKLSDWVDLDAVSSIWCGQVVEELMHWDGHDRYDDEGSNIVFGTTVPEDRDLVQAICALSGKICNVMTSQDPRKDTYKEYYRLSIRHQSILRTGSLQRQEVPYNGKVRCVTVPSGAIIVRYKGNVCVSGNCLHAASVIKLFRTFIQENPELWTEDLRREIYMCCATIVSHEDAFIKLAFEQGSVYGLTARETQQYIRYIADRRLIELGLNPLFKIEKNPLPWMDEMMNAIEHTNFFENRATEYSKSSTAGDWSEVFGDVKAPVE